MESQDERPPHDPDDARGGGGPGGGPGTQAQEEWKQSVQSKKDAAKGEPEPEEESGPFEGDVRA